MAPAKSGLHEPPARSRAYPLVDLKEACRLLQTDLAGVGDKPLSRKELSDRLGYQNSEGGIGARTVAALAHYGFLLRSADGHYALSDRGRHVQTLPTDSLEFKLISRIAMNSPALFRRIFERYRPLGRVPKPWDLASELTSAEFGITSGASTEAAAVFWRSASFAEILTSEGFFVDSPSFETRLTSPMTKDEAEHGRPETALTRYPIPLSPRRLAYFETPLDLNEAEFKILNQFMDSLLNSLSASIGLGKIKPMEARPRRRNGETPQE